LTGTTLFIADLHLDPARPAITDLFLDFLATEARAASALYILGDLFEAWVGDDDDAPHHRPVVTALRDLSTSGTSVWFAHGNRDFLLGESFAAASGAQLLGEETVIDLYGTATLLMHGDTLCTDDTAYLAFRAQVRDPAWQREFLAKPLAERRQIAQGLRERSAASTRDKPAEIMDVNAATVAQTMIAAGVRQLIHGHTHRPAIHEFELEGQTARRIVLGDWYTQGSVLRCSAEGCVLEGLPTA
jgi:UDP-2,3-diacylglucosamine hydrolase